MQITNGKTTSFLALIVLLAFANIGHTSAPMPAGAERLVERRNAILAEARNTVPGVSVQELKALVDANENIFIIDTRDPNEWAGGILAYRNTITISRGTLEFRAPALVGSQERIFVICKAGSRGLLAAQALRNLGYTNVSNVNGGMDAWVAAGFPVMPRP